MEDEELKRIRQKRLREMIAKSSGNEDEDRGKSGESAPTRPIEITDATFRKAIESHPVVVVDCWASWCAPCRILSPIIEELAQDCAGKILFAKLNVDENQERSLEYGIMSIPTLLVFKGGKLVDRIVGAMPRSMLEPKITRYLQ